MTRQAFLAQMPDPLSLRLSSSLSLSLRVDPPLAFSLFLDSLPLPPSFFFSPLLPSFSATSVSSLLMILFLTFSLSLLSFSSSSGSLPLQKSRAIALGGLSTLTDSWSHIAERRAHVLPCSGPSRQTNRKQTFMPLYLKRETFTHRG